MARHHKIVISKHKQLTIEFSEMCLARPDFIEAVKSLRRKWKIRTEIFKSESPEYDTEIASYFDNSHLDKDIKKLQNDLQLPDSWYEVIYFYLISDGYLKREGMWSENIGGLQLEQKTTGFHLAIGSESTFADIKNAWKLIKGIRNQKRSRKVDRDNAVRDLNIFKLHQDGLTITEICLEIEKKYNMTDLTETNIRKIVNETYNRHNTPKSIRRKLKTFSSK